MARFRLFWVAAWVVALLCTAVCASWSDGLSRRIRAPSVLPSEEEELHRYAAVLAATEPFREQCLSQICEAVSPWKALRLRLNRQPLSLASSLRQKNEAVDVALTRFELRVQNAVQAYGMTVPEFNSLSHVVPRQKQLKRKVLLQAYLYKIAADLERNLKQTVLPQLPSAGIPTAEKNRLTDKFAMIASGVTGKKDNLGLSPSERNLLLRDDNTPEITKFVRALRSVETERNKMRERLKNELQLTDLPPHIANERYLSAMSHTVQRAVKEFPEVAAKTITQHGLHTSEFDALRRKQATNPLFRWRVKRELKSQNLQAKRHAAAVEAAVMARRRAEQSSESGV